MERPKRSIHTRRQGYADRGIDQHAEQEIERLVSAFASVLRDKLLDAERKYGHNSGWKRDDWADKLRADIRAHVEKGDPRDVAAYCAFAWYHGWSLASPTDQVTEQEKT